MVPGTTKSEPFSANPSYCRKSGTAIIPNTGQMLALHGHNKLGFVCLRDSEYIRAIERGIARACSEYAIDQRLSVRLSSGKTYGDVADQLKEKQISAVVSSGDNSACRVIHELRRRNIRVPEDIGVVGIGDLPRDFLSEPDLSRININTELSGRIAAELLLANITHSVHRTVPVSFEKGGTLILRKVGK